MWNRSLVFGFAATVFSCVHDPLVPQGIPTNPENPPGEEEPCDPDVIYFETDVLPILVSNCAKSGCHNVTSAEEDIILDSYENVMSSDVIEVGDPNDSELYEKITENDPDDVMPPPPHQRLSTEQISKIRNWISQGAENITCSSAGCDTVDVTFNASIKPLLTNKCVGCHSGSVPSGNLNFTTHAGVQVPALDGRLLGAVTHANGFAPMPQGGSKLSDCEIRTIELWIEGGALNN